MVDHLAAHIYTNEGRSARLAMNCIDVYQRHPPKPACALRPLPSVLARSYVAARRARFPYDLPHTHRRIKRHRRR